MKKIIINADDFAMNSNCTNSIYAAYNAGLITDTTIAANGDDIERAFDYIKDNVRFAQAIGIHLNITDGRPLTKGIVSTRFVTNGFFNGYFKHNNALFLVLTKEEKFSIYGELDAQIKRIKHMGIQISHADSHHHVHTKPNLAQVFTDVCKDNNIRRIRLRKNVKRMDIIRKLLYNHYNFTVKKNGFRTTDFFGDATEYNGISDGISELMVHPGYIDGVLSDVLTKLPMVDIVNQIKNLAGNAEFITYNEV